MISGRGKVQRQRSRHITFLHVEDLLAEDKTEWAPLSFSRIMILPPLYADVPRHLPPPLPPPFPGAPPPPPMSGERPGLCGLTNNQWHMVLTFGILREWAIHPFPPILSILIRKGCRLLCVLRSTGCPFSCPRHLVVKWFRDLISLATGAGSCQIEKDGYVPPLFYSVHRTILTSYRYLSPSRQSIPNNFRVAREAIWTPVDGRRHSQRTYRNRA
jgi:hypothetical protein